MNVRYVLIPQEVRVRKHEVDEAKLKKLLKESRRHSGLNNENISEKLGVNLTKVEHWFRNDKWFCIPDSEIWMRLKELLGIITEDFDKSIMEFEIRDGTFEKSERTYLTGGLCPTLLTNEDINILVKEAEV